MPPIANGLKQSSAMLIERWLNRLRYKVSSPQFIIAALLFAALVYLVLGPLFQLTWRTLSWGEGDLRFSREAVPGVFTLAHWNYSLFGPSAHRLKTICQLSDMTPSTLDDGPKEVQDLLKDGIRFEPGSDDRRRALMRSQCPSIGKEGDSRTQKTHVR